MLYGTDIVIKLSVLSTTPDIFYPRRLNLNPTSSSLSSLSSLTVIFPLLLGGWPEELTGGRFFPLFCPDASDICVSTIL
jgi:hypothetical protein